MMDNQTASEPVLGNRVTSQYVVAFNGARDFYHLPLALYEGGLLSSLVTDFYYPHDRPTLRQIPGLSAIERRHSPSLPSTEVHWIWRALMPQIASRFYRADRMALFEAVDRTLSQAALAWAEHESANLFLYSHYAYQAFTSPRSRAMVKGLFMFHPHTDLIREILDRDFALFPECRQSYEAEHDTAGSAARLDELRSEWKYADFIVCASSFTARSLQHVGCSPNILSVVPYGIDVAAEPPTYESRDQRQCRFLFVGQGVQRKGLHHLLHAWGRLNLAGAELTIVATNIDAGIAALAGRNVRVLSRQSSADLRALYGESHVFVMPSLIEGFGLVYLEALAAGCYCIGTRNTGLADLQEFFPPTTPAISVIDAGDIDQLVTALAAAYSMYRRGELDRERTRQLTRQITWKRFRSAVAAIAGRMLQPRLVEVLERQAALQKIPSAM
jgi:glycosyltransferase involved in cell wall biosynthesis